jgi:hypothetical protein
MTAGAVGGLFLLVTADERGRVGMGRDRHCCIERSPRSIPSTRALRRSGSWARSSGSSTSLAPSTRESLHFARLRRCIRRVAGTHYCVPAPSEPYVRVAPHTAQASPEGSRADRSAGRPSAPRVRSRRQWVCTRRGRVGSSGVPPAASAMTAWLRIAWRTALNHCSHASGCCGSWSACSSRVPHSGQRPSCAWSRRRMVPPSGGLVRRRRLAQKSARAGSSTDAVPGTIRCRTMGVQANLVR